MIVTLFYGKRRTNRNVDHYKFKVKGPPVQVWQLFIVRCPACFGVRRLSSGTWFY